MMSHSRADEVIDKWKAVARTAIRPSHAPRPRSIQSSFPAGLLTGAAAVLVLVLIVSTRGNSQSAAVSSPTASSPTPTTTGSTVVVTSSIASQPSTTPGASESPISSAADQTPSVADASAAQALVNAYISDLVGSKFEAAYGLLSAESKSHWQSLADFTSERRAFFDSVDGRYAIKVWPSGVGSITDWLTDSNRSLIDLRHAVLVEVDYPDIATNAGYELFIVCPEEGGLEIFVVR